MKLVAVIVTYNRVAMLADCLAAYERQTHPPDVVLVVDNASSDGTAELLRDWARSADPASSDRVVVRMRQNVGGSGGFFAGTRASLGLGADWVWVADDDAFPEPDVFQRLVRHIA